jgi:hypothetical protein
VVGLAAAAAAHALPRNKGGSWVCWFSEHVVSLAAAAAADGHALGYLLLLLHMLYRGTKRHGK